MDRQLWATEILMMLKTLPSNTTSYTIVESKRTAIKFQLFKTPEKNVALHPETQSDTNL